MHAAPRPARPRHRRRGGLLVGIVVLGCFVAVAAVRLRGGGRLETVCCNDKEIVSKLLETEGTYLENWASAEQGGEK